MSARQWSRDLGLGFRFAFAGGREGWTRTLLTAVGVGLGVALLLLTTAIPNALAVRHDRESARSDLMFNQTEPQKGDDTLLVANAGTTFREQDVRGRVLEPEGPHAPVPPGVDELPGVDEMVVSPALKRLLESDEGKLLRDRLPQRIVGTIGESGLVGSQELAFYRGGEGLAARLDDGVSRLERFGDPLPSTERMDPVLLLLVLVVFVVLLMPVGVFVATAVRFGGERRDRRLAALRLVGSDSRMTRRVAAGEAMAGALLGLVFGTGFFLVGRQWAGSVEVFGFSAFPSYLNPSPLLALLVAVAVPVAAVLVTQFALRGVVIEPLGVVRTARPARRRLWWRLLLPFAGLAMLYPMVGNGRDEGEFNQYLVTGGVLLLLVGVTALLPWIVEAVVARLGAGAVSWQLAVRRLQLSSGTAARMVNGIAVAVAGAIALQMLFAGVDEDYTQSTGQDLTRAQMQVGVPAGLSLDAARARLEATEGVRQVYGFSEGMLDNRPEDPDRFTQVAVGDCGSLRELAALPSCRDGDVFVLEGAEYDTEGPALARPGGTLYFDASPGGDESKPVAWTVPEDVKRARSVTDPTGTRRGGVLLTPSALPRAAATAVPGQLYLRLDESVPDAREHVRNTAADIDPFVEPMTWVSSKQSGRFTAVRTGLFVGATCVLLLIGASLLVSQLEQLRERRKLLSSLIAFGTRRRTLSLSVLWQTAVPVALGLALACAVGLTLGTVLLKMTDTAVRVDWASVLTMTGMGAAVVLAVTLLSLPPLLRLMRPDGLRTE
ncbi:ABC transporter permease [Streptomyces glaucescens]|uniref:Integral membrane protein n=1 Tax=Streptomyces glaucescens TaxID=1907 RepID=A0A089X8N2_STRGA|nr:FtsX-like permease family protein [Streptomyces glaucescens]AIS00288.1 integral membrane protein [Streptomyces glaucescens]